MNLLNVHEYDGKLTFIIPDEVKNMKFEDKINQINKFREPFNLKLTTTAFDYFNRSYEELKQNNFDDKNNVNYVDILYLCYKNIDNDDFIKMINEQFEDMQTGFCIQGRTIRLIQILQAFE